MANFQTTQNHELKIQKWIKEGLGHRVLENNYKPWITIRDVSSEGLISPSFWSPKPKKLITCFLI